MLPLVLLAAVATAACPPGDMITSPQLYTVAAGARLAFYRTADCADASCREGAYVVPGDQVIVYQSTGTRSCAVFARARETTGWVDSNRLRPDVAASHPPITAWTGMWYDGDDRIRLTPGSKGRLDVDGEAYWPGAHPTKDWPSGWPHIGQLDGTAAISGNRGDFADGLDTDGCRATMRLLRDYLIVSDNGNCGGMNVSFMGIYRRRHARS